VKRLLAMVLLLGMVLPLTAATAGVVPADMGSAAPVPGESLCGKGVKSSRIVRAYPDPRGAPFVSIPLRCGNKSSGFRHLKARGRWTPAFDKRIRRTIREGTAHLDGWSTYVLVPCHGYVEQFRVVRSYKPGFGIQTAYWIYKGGGIGKSADRC
jgi:hypothetical protein